MIFCSGSIVSKVDETEEEGAFTEFFHPHLEWTGNGNDHSLASLHLINLATKIVVSSSDRGGKSVLHRRDGSDTSDVRLDTMMVKRGLAGTVRWSRTSRQLITYFSWRLDFFKSSRAVGNELFREKP